LQCRSAGHHPLGLWVAQELRKLAQLNETSLSQFVHDQKNGRLENKIKGAEK